jgi:hypothetical protein
MVFNKQYIIQAISVASNNLRLSSDKIETVAILRDHLQHSENLEETIRKMKAKTELSKFAIKLWEAFVFTNSANIDFLRISENFKEHSHNLVMELSNLLDIATPEKLNEIFNSMVVKDEISVNLGERVSKTQMPQNISVRKYNSIEEEQSQDIVERDELKEELILGGIEGKNQNNFDFDNYEEDILKPISKLEMLLKNLTERELTSEELTPFIIIMEKNARFSKEIGFSILADMHLIFHDALVLILEKNIEVDLSLIESLRACLIVIVAVVRGKDVDITNYLNKAENLGNYLKIDKE